MGYKEETKNEPGFVEKLASPFDLFVNDAFGTAHRAHASTEGVTKYLSPSVSGFLLAKELEFLDGAIKDGEKPLAAIVGGSKVSSKIGVLEALVDKCDKVIIGGGMVFTFLKARGLPTGSSLVEDDFVETAKKVEEVAAAKGCISSFPLTWFWLTNSLLTLRLRLPRLLKFLTAGWVWIMVRRPLRRFKPSSPSARPSFGTDQWVSLNLMPSLKAPSTLLRHSLSSPAKVLAPSSAVATPSLLLRRLVLRRRCPTCRLAVALPSSCWRARFFLVLLHSTSSKC